ncbi:MAG TPA: hypothetical protein VFK35_01420 [Candidatus Limnocylindrales bacterium]|nr:hypothetical protein [Candidatus Limnocylindrales bacterium]
MTVHRGSLIAATWLIGLGAVFLVRQALQLDWGEAWPLFVILVGVGALVGRAAGGVRGVAGAWDLTWPIVWIGIGVILLLSTTGSMGRSPGALISDGWPWLLVGLGAWFLVGAVLPLGTGPTESLTIPLGGIAEASVRIRFGAGELDVGPAAPGSLVDGSFIGGVVRRDLGPGRVELAQDTTDGLPWLDGPSRWAVGLAPEVPLDLRLETGAARAWLDLGDLRVRALDLQTGASETRIRLPRAAGATSVRAETGAASLTIEVPEGVAARIRSRMTIGSTQVDEARFPRAAVGFESPDYATAANRVDLDLQGGVGSVRVLGVA